MESENHSGLVVTKMCSELKVIHLIQYDTLVSLTQAAFAG